MLGSLCCFEPLQTLVETDCEDQVFLGHEQDLNDAVFVDFLLLQLQTEQAVLCFLPLVNSFENVHGAFRVAAVNLEFLANFCVETVQPHGAVKDRRMNGDEVENLLVLDEPGVQQKFASPVDPPDTHGFVSA